MQNYYQVMANQDISESELNKKLKIKTGDIFEAKDIIVTVNRKEHRHLGIQLKDGTLFSVEKLSHLFKKL